MRADPNDNNTNPLLKVESATIVEPMVPGESTVEYVFDNPVTLPPGGAFDAFGIRKNEISTSTWTTTVLEDLNGDGKLDLVVADSLVIRAYLNTGSAGNLLFQGEGTTIATRQLFNPPQSINHYFDSAVAFGDADNDGDRDLICGEKADGSVVYFPMINGTYLPGQLHLFATQKRLRFESGGTKSNIANAAEDQSDSTADQASASPAIVKFDNDNNYDLVVADNLFTAGWEVSQRHVIFWVYRYAGIDTQNGNAPYYMAPFRLEVNGAPAVISQFSDSPVITFIDVDGQNGDDLVVSLESGNVYYALNTGQRSGAGYLQFQSFQTFHIPTLPYYSTVRASAVATDADSDGDVDLLVSCLSASGPARRQTKLFRSVGASFGSLSSTGDIIGSANAPQSFITPDGSGSPSLDVGDLDDDGKPDLVQGLVDGTIAVSFSTDTGDDFDPVFASPILCRNINGGVFTIPPVGFVSAVPRAIPYDPDLNGTVDGLVLAVFGKLYYCSKLGINEDGALRLSDPQEIPVPPALGTGTLGYASVAFGDFTPGDENVGVDGAIFMRQNFDGAPAWQDLEIYYLPVTASLPIQFGVPVLVAPVSDFTYPARSMRLRDLDGDGDLDMISSSAAVFAWWKNNSGPGAVTSLVQQSNVIHPDGTSAYYNGSVEAFCIIEKPTLADSRPFVLAATKKLSEVDLARRLRVHRLNGLNPSGQLVIEREAAPREFARVEQTLPSKVQVDSPDTIRVSIPLKLSEGDIGAINRVFVGTDPVSIASETLHDSDGDKDGLPRAWEIAHGTNPDVADSGGQFQGGGGTNQQAYQAGVQANPSANLTNLDGDSVENEADADPNDSVVDWRAGPNPAFVIKELELGDEDLDDLLLDDLAPDGTMLFTKVENYLIVERVMLDFLGNMHKFSAFDPDTDGEFGSSAAQLFDDGFILGYELQGDELEEGLWEPITDVFIPEEWRATVGYHDQIRDFRNGVALWRGSGEWPLDAETGLRTSPSHQLLPGPYALESSNSAYDGSIEENGNIVAAKAYWRWEGSGYGNGMKLPSSTAYQSATLERSKIGGGTADKWNLVPTSTGLAIAKNGGSFKRAKGSLGSRSLQAVNKLGWVFKTQDDVTQVWANGKWKTMKDVVSLPESPYLQFKVLRMIDTGLGVALVQKTGGPRKLALFKPAPVQISTVTFSQGTALINDDGSPMGSPHWVDLKNNTVPADTFPDGRPDKADPPVATPNDVMSYAYSYVSNKKPKVAATFQWQNQPPAENAPYSAQGRVVDTPNCDFILTKQPLTDNSTTYPGLVSNENIVTQRMIQGYVTPNRKVVRKVGPPPGGADLAAGLKPVTIEWTITDKNDNVVSTSRSTHAIYVTWDEPVGPSRKETVFNLSCCTANGMPAGNATEKLAVFDKIWSDFTDLSVLSMNGTPLKYWGAGAATTANTAALLLEKKDGKCVSWAQLLVEAANIQGMTEPKHVTVLPFPFVGAFTLAGGAVAPGVCGFPHPGLPGNGFFTKALPGQSNPTPPRNFIDHAVVAWAPGFLLLYLRLRHLPEWILWTISHPCTTTRRGIVRLISMTPRMGPRPSERGHTNPFFLEKKTYAVIPSGAAPFAVDIAEDPAVQDASFYNN